MIAVLVTPAAKAIPLFDDAVYVGVDAGAARIVQAGLPLAMAIGDFDSGDCRPDLGCPVLSYPVEKDWSDLELALQWAGRENFERIVVTGAVDGRLDHTVANLKLLEFQYPHVVFWETDQQVFVLEPGTHRIPAGYANVSFFAVQDSNLSLQGFQYPLTDHHLRVPDVLCLSNHVTGSQGIVRLRTGRLLCILTNR